jgi:hypothetical protein
MKKILVKDCGGNFDDVNMCIDMDDAQTIETCVAVD